MSQAKRRAPVSTSKPLITPEAFQRFWPSSTWWPVTITPRTITGGEVMDTMPGYCSPMPSLMSTAPFWPNAGQGRPVRASTAMIRPSSVPSITLVAQGWAASAPARA